MVQYPELDRRPGMSGGSDLWGEGLGGRLLLDDYGLRLRNPLVRVWNGSEWVAKRLLSWGGSEWGDAPAYWWDGERWVSIVNESLTPTIRYNGYRFFDSVSSASLDVTDFDFGPSRKVIALSILGSATSTTSVSGVTVNGTAATSVVSVSGARFGAIFYVELTTASGTVTINFSAPAEAVFVSSASILSASSVVPVGSINNSSADLGVDPSLSRRITSAGSPVVFSAYHAGSVSAGTTSAWTGVDEQTDFFASARSAQFTDAAGSRLQTTVAATLTDSLVNRPMLIGAVWK